MDSDGRDNEADTDICKGIDSEDGADTGLEDRDSGCEAGKGVLDVWDDGLCETDAEMGEDNDTELAVGPDCVADEDVTEVGDVDLRSGGAEEGGKDAELTERIAGEVIAV